MGVSHRQLPTSSDVFLKTLDEDSRSPGHQGTAPGAGRRQRLARAAGTRKEATPGAGCLVGPGRGGCPEPGTGRRVRLALLHREARAGSPAAAAQLPPAHMPPLVALLPLRPTPFPSALQMTAPGSGHPLGVDTLAGPAGPRQMSVAGKPGPRAPLPHLAAGRASQCLGVGSSAAHRPEPSLGGGPASPAGGLAAGRDRGLAAGGGRAPPTAAWGREGRSRTRSQPEDPDGLCQWELWRAPGPYRPAVL